LVRRGRTFPKAKRPSPAGVLYPQHQPRSPRIEAAGLQGGIGSQLIAMYPWKIQDRAYFGKRLNYLWTGLVFSRRELVVAALLLNKYISFVKGSVSLAVKLKANPFTRYDHGKGLRVAMIRLQQML
jgi:hypothetical protein